MTLRLLSAADSLRPLLAAASQGPSSPDASSAALSMCAGSVCGMREHARGCLDSDQACVPRSCAAAEAAGWGAESRTRPDAGWPGSSAAACCSTASSNGLPRSMQEPGPVAGLRPQQEPEHPRQPDSAGPHGHAEHAGHAGAPGPADALEGDGQRRGSGGASMLELVQRGQCQAAELGPAEALDRRMAAAAGPAWAPEPELILVSRASIFLTPGALSG